MTPRDSMRTAAVVAAMIVPTAAWAGQQLPAPQMPDVRQPVAQAAVTGCAQAHPMAERTIDMTNRRLEAARQANSPAAMRAAIDDMQAALRQLRTEIAPCAGLQSLAAADPPAGHVMPSAAQAPIAGAPVTRPGSTAPTPAASAPAAPAPGAADPHAGHVMPATPQTPAAPPRATPAQRPAVTPPKQPRTTPSPAAAADPHAGHAMPAAPKAPPVPPLGTTPPRPTTPPPAAAADPHAGHVTPGTPQSLAAADAHAVHAMTTVENPAARLADLTCQPQVDANTAPRATYMGKAYYFCTAAERDLFLKAPTKYLQNR